MQRMCGDYGGRDMKMRLIGWLIGSAAVTFVQSEAGMVVALSHTDWRK